jgi:hypothetical protein
LFLGDISDSKDEDEGCEDDTACKPGEDSYEDSVSDGDSEPTDESAKFVWRAQSVWEHYKPKLLTYVSSVAYLCSPSPHIIEHSQDTANSDPKTLIAVDQVIERLFLWRYLVHLRNVSEMQTFAIKKSIFGNDNQNKETANTNSLQPS